MEILQPLLTFVSDESYNLGTAVGIADLDSPPPAGAMPGEWSEYLFLALGTDGKPPGRLYIVWNAPRRYFDLDGDGFVWLESGITYGAPLDDGSPFFRCGGDCGENDPGVHPAQHEGLEFCADGLDNDCNGGVDDGEDLDKDGFGVCQDCDDADEFYFPEGYTVSGEEVLVCAQPFSCRDEGWPTSDPGGCLSWTTGPPAPGSQGTSSGRSGVILLGGLTVLRLRRRSCA